MPRFAIKVSLVAAAAFAAGVTVGPMQQVVAQAGSADTFRQLKLFGDVFERVRAEYVEEVTDQKLIEAAINGMLTVARPAFQLPRHRELPRHAGADPRRVRRPRHRGHDGERPGQGRLADRRHARLQGRGAARRPHHPHRRRGRHGPVAERGGREDARPGRQQDRPPPPAQGQGGAVRRHPEPGGDQDLAGPGARRGRCRLRPADHVQRADRDRDARQARGAEGQDRRQAHRRRARPAQQSGRAARPGGGGGRRVPRQGRDRLDPRPPAGLDPALQLAARRHRSTTCRWSC